MGFRQNQESSVAHSKHQRKPCEIWMVTKQSLREHRIREVVPLSDIAVCPKSHLGRSGKGPASMASVPSVGFDGKIFVLSEKFCFVFLGKSIWSLFHNHPLQKLRMSCVSEATKGFEIPFPRKVTRSGRQRNRSQNGPRSLWTSS